MKNFDEGYEADLPVLDERGEVVVDERTKEPVTEPVLVSRLDRAARDRTFVICGTEFVCRPAVTPESILEWTQMIQGETEPTELEALAIYDRTILAFLEPGQEDRWMQVRRPDSPDPINLTDLRAVLRWLFEAQTGRPTGRPKPSSPGAGANGTSLTDVSSSTDIPVGVPV